MPLTYASRGSGDDTPTGAPSPTAGQTNHIEDASAAQISTESSDPLAYAELDSTSDDSETTYSSPGCDVPKAASSNVLRLIPIPNHSNRIFFHMEVVVREPGQEFCVQTPDGMHGHMTMGGILRCYSDTIYSIAFDATALPNPESPSAMASAVALPFAPSAIASKPYAPASVSTPVLTVLKDLSIATGRAVSVFSLLEFLHLCPMLKSLAIYNSMRHICVLPESLLDISAPVLPHLSEVIVDGLLTHTTEHLLDKLLPSLKESTKVEVHFYHVSFPVLQHGPALQKLFAPVRHVCVSYSVFPAEVELNSDSHSLFESETESARKEPVHLLTCSDVDSRVQLHWHWTPVSGAPPNLMHIGLASQALAQVRTLSLSLWNARPSFHDLRLILQSFRGLKRLELHTTQSLLDEPASKPCSDSDSHTKAGVICGEDHRPRAFFAQHRIFTVRAAPVLRMLADVPLLFATKVAPYAHAPLARSRPCTPPTSPPRLASATGGYQPLLLLLAPPPGADADPHLRGLAAIVQPPLLGPMMMALAPQWTPRPAATSVVSGAETQIPAHMRGLARFYYDPLWALMVRTPARWEP